MAAEMLDRLSQLWLHNFKGCNKRAHWHLANLLRFETGPLGVRFAQAEGYLKAQIGTDVDAAKNRITELRDYEILSYTDDDLTARSIIKPRENLFRNFAHYHANALREIFKYAGLSTDIIPESALDNKIEGYIYAQTKFVYRELNIGRETFICKQIEGDIDEAVRANLAMRRRSHWTMFLTLWLTCGNGSSEMSRQQLIGEVRRRGIEEGEDILRNYITDLVTWGFLARTDNRNYTVSEKARQYFSNLFLSVGDSMRRGASQIQQVLP